MMGTVTELRVPDFLWLAGSADLEYQLSDLVRRSGDLNPFYETWMLFPAVRLLAGTSDLRLVIIRDGAGRVIAFLPFERTHHSRISLIPVLKLWRHDYCFLCTPLIDKDCSVEASSAFAGWLESGKASADIVQFHSFATDGTFAADFLPALSRRSGWVTDSGSRTRALFRRGADSRERISAKHAKELRRIERRLRDLGIVEYRALSRAEDWQPWVEKFLELERSGWKGRSGTAMAARDTHREYFRAVTAAAHVRRRLQVLSVELNGIPIAMKCNFLALPGSFAFKIAYDENYRKYSPGLLLELFNMHFLNAHCSEIDWMDSCADPGHAMIERLWAERRDIGSHSSACRGLIARTLIAVAPRYRRMKAATRGQNDILPSPEATT